MFACRGCLPQGSRQFHRRYSSRLLVLVARFFVFFFLYKYRDFLRQDLQCHREGRKAPRAAQPRLPTPSHPEETHPTGVVDHLPFSRPVLLEKGTTTIIRDQREFPVDFSDLYYKVLRSSGERGNTVQLRITKRLGARRRRARRAAQPPHARREGCPRGVIRPQRGEPARE